jgi:hypothetical protein
MSAGSVLLVQICCSATAVRYATRKHFRVNVALARRMAKSMFLYVPNIIVLRETRINKTNSIVIPNVASRCFALLRIREVPGSNLSLETDYTD